LGVLLLLLLLLKARIHLLHVRRLRLIDWHTELRLLLHAELLLLLLLCCSVRMHLHLLVMLQLMMLLLLLQLLLLQLQRLNLLLSGGLLRRILHVLHLLQLQLLLLLLQLLLLHMLLLLLHQLCLQVRFVCLSRSLAAGLSCHTYLSRSCRLLLSLHHHLGEIWLHCGGSRDSSRRRVASRREGVCALLVTGGHYRGDVRRHFRRRTTCRLQLDLHWRTTT
jgi:hypothetical protein